MKCDVDLFSPSYTDWNYRFHKVWRKDLADGAEYLKNIERLQTNILRAF